MAFIILLRKIRNSQIPDPIPDDIYFYTLIYNPVME